MKCLVLNCNVDTPDHQICITHWKMLDIKTKQDWWKATDYGEKRASDEMVQKINDVVAFKATSKEH